MTGIYHGWTESEDNRKWRTAKHELAHYEAVYGKDWEQDADAVRTLVESLDTSDWLDGTEPSPIISGGEVLWIKYSTGHDDIPF